MAAAADDDGQVDDDEFYEYNPHPYGGGYDIAATYGAPLPPSPSTCYPVSSPASAAPPAPAPATPPRYSPPAPAPATPPRAPPSPAKPRPVSPPPPAPVVPAVPVAEPFYWPKPHDYGDDDAPRWPPAYPTPEVFRGWPNLPCRPHCCHAHTRCSGPRDYWRHCMRGLDFLFGHTDGYGERRIGTDCHGVPVYANRKGGAEDAVVVEVPPPAVGSVRWHDAGEEVPAFGNVQQWHDAREVPAIGSVQWNYASEATDHQSNRLSWYDNAEKDTYAYAHSTYASYDSSYEQSYSQSYGVDVVSDEPTSWFPNQSYQDVYKQDESHYQEVLSTYGAENNLSSQPIYSYNQHFSEQPLHVQVEPPETVYTHKLEYHEEVLSTYGAENSFSSQPIYCYNQHFSEQPLHVQVEPPEKVYSHKLEYHENFSTYTNQTNIDNLEMSIQSREIQPYAYVPDAPLEPYQPSWSMGLGYYQARTGEEAPEYNNHDLQSGEYGDMASLFSSSSYPQQVEVYEPSYGDEYISLEQNYESSWNVFPEDNSEITKSGEDFNHPNGSFWPFGGY